MIDTDSLRHALGALEAHTPAEGEVLAGFRAGVVRRRRHRQLASVVGVAGLAGAVALGVVLVSPGQQSPGQTIAPATSIAVAKPPPTPRPALPFTVGWVPDGYTLGSWETGVRESSAQYSGSKDFQTIVVWISAEPRPVPAGAHDQPTTIAGRPGVVRKIPPDTAETQLIWQRADGRWAMVGGRVPTVPLAALTHVAESLTATPTPLPVAFTLRTVPDGYRVSGWSAGDSVRLCRSVTDPGAADCIGLSLRSGAAPRTTQLKRADASVAEVPVDRERTVGGVPTRADATGMTVFAQVDAGHWVYAFSARAGADLLREAATMVVPD
jgi:hypothetical protein